MNIQTFYKSSFLASLADGMISPFLSIFALSLGATKMIIGLLSSLPTLASLLSQVLWAALTETMKKKSWMIILGGVLWSLLWIPIAFVHDPIQLIFLIAIQSFLSAMTTPAWTSFLIMLIPSYKRGEINADINTIAAIASFIGTMISGFLLNKFGFVYGIFFAVCFLGLMSRIPFLFTQEPKTPVYSRGIVSAIKNTFSIFNIKREKKLVNLMKAIIFLNFAVTISGPFFSIHVIQNIGGTNMDIAIITALGVISTIIFYKPWGMLIDYLGRKVIMLSCIIPVSFLPFVYAFAPNIQWLYVYSIIANMSWGGFNLAAFAYLSDIIPKERTSSFISFYNLLTGLSSVIGPFVGGIIADYTNLPFIFILSTFLRLCSIYFVDALEEKSGIRPAGVFKFGFVPLDLLSYRIESFVFTYSLVMREATLNGMKLLKVKKQVKNLIDSIKSLK